jgi:hypothetical protein
MFGFSRNGLTAHRAPAAPAVLGNDDPILGDAGRENSTIRLAASADVERMDGVVPACGVQPKRELR